MQHLRFLLLCLAMALASVGHAQSSALPEHITIHGHPYAIQLQENVALLAKLGDAAIAEQGRHFGGQLVGQENSWLRISQLAGKWSGIVSLAGTSYIIEDLDASVDSSLPAHNKQRHSTHVLSAKPTGALAAAATVCATDANLGTANSSAPRKSHSALSPPTAQQVQFDSICATTVDGVCMFAEMEFVFDLEFQQRLGDGAQGTAAAIINMAEGFYENDLRVSFDTITVQFLNADLFSSSTTANTLLVDIRDKKRARQLPFIKNERALLHVVTGRYFRNGTAGIAYTGVLCDGTGNGVGTSQLLSGHGTNQAALTALVVAHEIGHNFGANHDGASGNTCADGFIMESRVNSSTSSFSSCSIAEMEQTVSAVSRPERCFNFPVDIAIRANTENTAEVIAGKAFTTEYTVNTNAAFLALPQLRVVGSVAAEQGRFVAVTLNGAACEIVDSQQAYSCTLNNPGGVANLKVIARGKQNAAAYSHMASVGGSSDLLDTVAENNQLTANFSVMPAPPGTVFKDDAEFAITPIDSAANGSAATSSSSGGGGLFAGPALLMLFAALLWQRISRPRCVDQGVREVLCRRDLAAG